MRYFLDTEFNGFDGELISLALVREDGPSLYVAYELPAKLDPWVEANVVPILYRIPSPKEAGITAAFGCTREDGAELIEEFLSADPDPLIVTDWPDDVRYFCREVITGPGRMIDVDGLRFEVVRVDAYPTSLSGAVQHNAWWDAVALRAKLSEAERAAA